MIFCLLVSANKRTPHGQRHFSLFTRKNKGPRNGARLVAVVGIDQATGLAAVSAELFFTMAQYLIGT